jgi:cytochrome b
MISVIIWAPFTRIIHWAIALPVLLNFFIDGGDYLHKVIGYVAFTALLVRIVWGFVTKDKAHFKFFPLNPSELKSYTLALISGKKKDYPGHNPLASMTYVFIWILVGLLGITGYLMGQDAYWGEEWPEHLHESLSHGLVALVIFHIFGMTLDGIKNKRKTWLGMITGKR